MSWTSGDSLPGNPCSTATLTPATAAVDAAARPTPTVMNGLTVPRRAGCSMKRHERYAKPIDAAAKAVATAKVGAAPRSEEHTSELQSLRHLVCRLLLEK